MNEYILQAQKYNLALIPIEVYGKYKDWNEPWLRKDPISTMWVAMPVDASVFLPLDDYKIEFEDWVDNIDVTITTDMLADTPKEAIEKAIARIRDGGA